MRCKIESRRISSVYLHFCLNTLLLLLALYLIAPTFATSYLSHAHLLKISLWLGWRLLCFFLTFFYYYLFLCAYIYWKIEILLTIAWYFIIWAKKILEVISEILYIIKKNKVNSSQGIFIWRICCNVCKQKRLIYICAKRRRKIFR